ncbi:MAG: Ig-like domain-containing protein [Deltaproteobacteria bacterium]|nr:Ig-like domain-containing protein [Deltaproteobacteria bacterium]
MRAVVVAVLAFAFAPSLAAAEAPAPPIVWKNQVRRPAPGVVPALVSNKLYLNDCRPNGCTLNPGSDDSRTNHSSIVQSQVRLDAWAHGDVMWAELVQCVKDTFLPFEIEVVTTDPGTANHSEVMIGGLAAQLSPDLVAGGVAPFIGCGATEDNVISFVFAGGSTDLEFMCGAVAQEACHVWGLDHELNKLDPMTYLDLGTLKRFQNASAQCGETLDAPRECYCSGNTQNSFQYMTAMFGGANLPPPQLVVSTPTEGQWVQPGFPIRAVLMSPLGATSATLSVDGVETASLSPGPFGFNAPATLAGGDHTVSVTGTDGGGRAVTETVNVHVTATCGPSSGCNDGFHCLGGFCLPGKQFDGGLGADCTSNDTCITASCGTANGEQLCTAQCDSGNSCPAGFTCLGANLEGGVCWPVGDDGGCAAGGGGGAPGLVLAGLGLLALVGRRRR